MIKLTTAQQELLQASASIQDGLLEADQTGPGKRVAAALIRQGLMLSIPVAGGGRRLLITAEGRSAIAAAAEGPVVAARGARRGDAPATDGEVTSKSEAPNPPPAKAEAVGKVGVLIGLLRRGEGATIADLMAATGWQAHSVRGAISGAIKKQRGLEVASSKEGDQRIYRIVGGAG